MNGDAEVAAHFVNTGVPHAVVFVDNPDSVDVPGMGRVIRFHPEFAPGRRQRQLRPRGRTPRDADPDLRTGRRRGNARLRHRVGRLGRRGRRARSRGLARDAHRPGGIGLSVHFARSNGTFGDIDLEGDARIVCKGEIMREAWE